MRHGGGIRQPADGHDAPESGDHAVIGNPNVIDRQRGLLVLKDITQALGQIDQRVQVTGVDRFLVGGARCLGLVPVQENRPAQPAP